MERDRRYRGGFRKILLGSLLSFSRPVGYHVQITPLDSRTQGRDVTENDHSYFLLFLYYLPFSSPIHTTDCRLMLGPELYSTYQILNQNYLVHILYI